MIRRCYLIHLMSLISLTIVSLSTEYNIFFKHSCELLGSMNQSRIKLHSSIFHGSKHCQLILARTDLVEILETHEK